jgi:hypothetical protein
MLEASCPWLVQATGGAVSSSRAAAIPALPARLPERRMTMALIDDYARDPQRALIDIVQDPVFRNFIDPSEIELVAVDLGDGTQTQAQALKRSAVSQVLRRLFDTAKQAQVDLRQWICSPDEFNFCGKLNNSLPGVMMKELNDFLRNRWTQATTVSLGAFAAFSQLVAAVTLGKFLAVLAAVGFVNNAFVELCNCPGG